MGERSAIKGWESSEDEQKQFVERFFAQTAGLQKLEAAIWIHLYEQAGGVEPFVTMALGKSDGTLKPAWSTWVSATR